MYKATIFVLLALLLAGCIAQPLVNQQTLSQDSSVNASEVQQITTTLERLAKLQGQPLDLQLKSSKNVEMVELVYTANGQDIVFYVTPDYKNLVIPAGGNATSIDELNSFLSQAEASQQEQQVQEASFPKIEANTANMKGNPSAKIKIIEFSDFQCPFCKRFFDQTYSQLIENYVDTGKVAFYYMHFPLDSIHPMARPSAIASECAAEQGYFWEMHDLIFQNQDSLSTTTLKGLAEGIEGLNATQFNNCLDNSTYESKVESELQAGLSYGVRGTPAFFIVAEDLPPQKVDELKSISSAYSGNVVVGSSGNETVVFVSGALPYAAFDQILSTILG